MEKGYIFPVRRELKQDCVEILLMKEKLHKCKRTPLPAAARIVDHSPPLYANY